LPFSNDKSGDRAGGRRSRKRRNLFPQEATMAMPERSQRVDETLYASRTRTFHGFLHMSKWFTIHSALILVGLYLWGVQSAEAIGLSLVFLGVVTLVYGAGTTSSAAARAAEDRRAE
jgi:hypothetical protein